VLQGVYHTYITTFFVLRVLGQGRASCGDQFPHSVPSSRNTLLAFVYPGPLPVARTKSCIARPPWRRSLLLIHSACGRAGNSLLVGPRSAPSPYMARAARRSARASAARIRHQRGRAR